MGSHCSCSRSNKRKSDSDSLEHHEKDQPSRGTECPVPPASALRYDKEHWKAIEPFAGQQKPVFRSALELRAFTEDVVSSAFRLEPVPGIVAQTKFEAAPTRVSLTRFATAAQEGAKSQPAVLFIHGGGLISCSVEIFAPELARYVYTTGVQFWAVDYRLAPEHPCPAGFDFLNSPLIPCLLRETAKPDGGR